MKRALLVLGSLRPEESVQPAELKILEENFRIIHLNRERDPEATIRENAKDIVAIMTTLKPVSAKLMDALPNLEIISCFSVGFDHVDLKAAAARGIPVTNTPDVLTAETADTALALTLAVAKRVCEADMFVRVGKWAGGEVMPLGTSLSGKTAGIVGLGRIGQAIAKRLAAFDMDIAYFGRREREDQPYQYYADLKEMAEASDFLVFELFGRTGDAKYDQFGNHAGAWPAWFSCQCRARQRCERR